MTLTFPDNAGTSSTGTLIDPNGQAVASESTTRADAAGNTTDAHALQAYHLNPQPGRWRFVVDVTNPVGGNALSTPYSTAASRSRSPKATVSGLPNSSSTVLPARQGGARDDQGRRTAGRRPRTCSSTRACPGTQDLPLLALTPDQNLPLPLSPDDLPPLYLMPSQTSAAFAAAKASIPVTFDWGFGDPHLAATSSGNTAASQFSAPELTPSIWFIAPTAVGPFSAPITAGTVSTGLVARTAGFDLDADPSTGDAFLQTVDPNAAAFKPVTVGPGKTGTLRVTITPSGRRGTVVSGTLFVDDFSNFLAFGNELLAIPYQYTRGLAHNFRPGGSAARAERPEYFRASTARGSWLPGPGRAVVAAAVRPELRPDGVARLGP